ncbi:MAG: PHP domain-containing protein [Acidobacteria bacterium]|nr:PHP domain-containing protein [Acidobacteriota bacterium]
MRAGFYDLHIHSNYSSDADHPPRRLFEMACEAGLAGLCISDHDTVAAIAEGTRLAREFPLEFYPNVEISTHYLARKFHVLAPLVDYRSVELRSRLQGLAEGRRQQAKARVERLRASGFEITFEEVIGATRNPIPTGPAIAQALLAKPESRESPRLRRYLHGKEAARGVIAFYRDFFAQGKPAFAEMERLCTLEALQLIRRAGGVPVLAHPGAPGYEADETVLETFVAHGLGGLEVHSSYHDPQSTRRFSDWAARWELVKTAGSDFHGRVKPHVRIGSVKARGREMIEELMDRRD